MNDIERVATPRDVWVRTHIYQDGHMLRAKTYLVAAQNPEVFEVAIDLRPIATAVARYHKHLHSQVSGDCVGCDEAERAAIEGCVGCDSDYGIGALDPEVAGFFSSIGKIVKSVGKSKLLNKVANVSKAIIKSKVTGAALVGLTAVFPPVGAPALGAYAAANASLAAIEKANALKKAVSHAVRDTKSGKTTKRVVALAKVKSSPTAKARAVKVIKQGAASKKFIRTLTALATYSPDPAKKAEAQKAVHIYRTVAAHRDSLRRTAKRSPKKGTTGLVVDSRGRAIRGTFLKEQAKRGAEAQVMLAAQGRVIPGYFRKVGGCIGCW